MSDPHDIRRWQPFYISGPMTGLPGDNFDAFNAAEARLRAAGVTQVFNPARNGPITPAYPRSWHMRQDYRDIYYSRSVLLLPGWRPSFGGVNEVRMARDIGLRLWDAETLAPFVGPREFTGRIIGLLGYKRVGKDSIQQALGIPRVSFADRMRETTDTLAKSWGYDLDADKETLRPFYELFATLARGRNPAWAIEGAMFPQVPEVAITDVRAENEAEFITARGGLLIHVTRPGRGPDPSQPWTNEALAGLLARYSPPVVHNDGTIAEAGAKARALIDAHFTRQQEAA